MPDRPSHTSKIPKAPAVRSMCYAPVPLAVPCEVTINEVKKPELSPVIPSPLNESSAAALEWPRLRDQIAGRTSSPLGRSWILALEPSSNLAWIDQEQQRTAEVRAMLLRGGSFEFHGLFDPTIFLDKARIDGAALESTEIRDLLAVVERIAAWGHLIDLPKNPPTTNPTRYGGPAIIDLSLPLLDHDLAPLLRLLRGKIEPDGSLNDDASPELRRIRRAIERQHRSIEESRRKSLRGLSEGGSTQEDLITIRGDRFVIPVKAEFKRKVPGVVHGSSSSGQTVFVEPLETIEQNNELVRLLDEEQAEIHRILVEMTRRIGDQVAGILASEEALGELELQFAKAHFAEEYNCAAV